MQRVTRNNNPGIRRNSSKWPIIFAATGLLLIYFLFFHGDYGLIQYWKLSLEKDRLKEKIVELKKEQAELKQEIQRLEKDYQYIEKVARERYKMGREGEKIFIIKK